MVAVMGGFTSYRTLLASLLAFHALGACGGEVDRDHTGTSGGSASLVASSGGRGSEATGGTTAGGQATGGTDCDTRLRVYYAAVAAATRCDPAAAEPCAAYDGVECPPVGVNPDSVAALSAELSDYEAAGCALPLRCSIWTMTPAPYTCQAGEDGLYKCYSFCEQMWGGRATCVDQSTGCPNMVLDGFCSGTSMSCCSPY